MLISVVSCSYLYVIVNFFSPNVVAVESVFHFITTPAVQVPPAASFSPLLSAAPDFVIVRSSSSPTIVNSVNLALVFPAFLHLT